MGINFFQKKDTDNDGLTNQEEKKIGTDPCKKDTDNDGLTDWEEVKIYKTDPLNPDTDKDGVKDGQEALSGRNPLGAGRLKDFFIPTPKNNYQPKILHPKRIIFYAVSSVIIKTLVIFFLFAMPISAWLTPDILNQESEKIIKLTNEIRKKLNLPLLEKDILLNQVALAKAKDMLTNQYFAHESPLGKKLSDWLEESGYDYEIAGENLAIGFISAEEVVRAWEQSQSHYENIIEPRYQEIGVGMISGEYNGKESTLVAQYFASPAKNNTQNYNKPKNKKTKIIFSKSYLSVSKNDKKTIKAQIYLEGEIQKAEIEFKNYILNLKKDKKNNKIWRGTWKVNENIFSKTIIPATVKVYTQSGEIISGKIGWKNITPLRPSLIKQYFFMKRNQTEYIKPLFDISSTYYKIIAISAFLILLINIFVEIRYQQPRVIFSTLGLIGLLVVLIYI